MYRMICVALVVVSLLACSEVVFAQAGIVWNWRHPQSGAGDFIGAKNMDIDPQDEIVYVFGSNGSKRLVIVDALTGSVEWDSGIWYFMTHPSYSDEEQSGFVDLDGNGTYGFVFQAGLLVTDVLTNYLVRLTEGASAAPEQNGVPTVQPSLADNYPNPFNPATTIEFDTPKPGKVRLDVYDVRGALVRRLVDEVRPAGTQSVVWDGRDDDGRTLSSGIYIYRLEASGHALSEKAVLLK